MEEANDAYFPYFRKIYTFLPISVRCTFFGLIYVFLFLSILTKMQLSIMIYTYWTLLILFR